MSEHQLARLISRIRSSKFAVSIAVLAAVFAPQATIADMLAGADVSILPQVEAADGVFRDESGSTADALQVMSDAGIDAVRLRLWVAPPNGHSDISEVLALSQRAAALGMEIVLNLHYSDTWADPGQQTKPAAWATLEPAELVDQVADYTQETITALVEQGTPPSMIQLGNEITPGFLWPDGMLTPLTDTNWEQFSELLRAAAGAVRAATPANGSIDIVLHIDRGADNATARWFFDGVVAAGIDFDVIGLSYYPWWHGDLEQFEDNLRDLASEYGRDVALMETAYPFTLDYADNTHNIIGLESQLHANYPATGEGQRAFVAEVTRIVASLPEGRGVFYWSPDWISTSAGSPWENLALFDFSGRPLPAMAALSSAVDDTPPPPPPQPPLPSRSGGGAALWLLLLVATGVLRGRRTRPRTR